MNLVEKVKLSPEEESKRDSYLFTYHADHSKLKGDWHFRQAEQISGEGDMLDADAGEPPHGAKWDLEEEALLKSNE